MTNVDDFKSREDAELSNHRDPEGYLSLKVAPLSSVPFHPLPNDRGSGTCEVSILSAGVLVGQTWMMLRGFDPKKATDPLQREGKLRLPDFAFLVESRDLPGVVDGKNKRLVFDLGLKENLGEYSPSVQKMMKSNWEIKSERSVAYQLEDGGVDPATVGEVVFIQTFPGSTNLVVGPGTFKASRPGYPSDPESSQLASDLPADERTVTELPPLQQPSNASDVSPAVDKSRKWEKVGAFDGIDWWGDGSVWLLHAPGHKAGHLAVLVRTSINPKPTYILLCGDAAHHRSLFSPFVPSHDRHLAGLFPKSSDDTLTSMHDDLHSAYDTLAKIGRMELEDDVLVLLAHDDGLETVLRRDEGKEGGVGFFPGSGLAGWKEKGWKERITGGKDVLSAE